MTQEVYDEKMMQIDRSYKAAKNELYKEFAYANNPYKIGDIVSDHMGSIKIERINVCLSYLSTPLCVYFGTEYTKKGEPNKRGGKRSVYQINIKNN